MAKNETFSILTSGAADSLDGISSPSNGDFAFGIVSGLMHSYVFDTSETGSENSPYQIKADDATTGSWMLVGFKGAMSHVSATETTGQSVSNTSNDKIIFNSESKDSLGEFNTTTGVFTATYAGRYIINSKISMSSATYTSLRLFIYKNTSTLLKRGIEITAGSIHISIFAIVDLAATDTIQINILQTSGGAETLVTGTDYNWLTIDRIA